MILTKLSCGSRKVLAAERIAGSEKLLKLQISLGDETRQLVAGVGKVYEPEALVGKEIAIVANMGTARADGSGIEWYAARGAR